MLDYKLLLVIKVRVTRILLVILSLNYFRVTSILFVDTVSRIPRSRPSHPFAMVRSIITRDVRAVKKKPVSETAMCHYTFGGRWVSRPPRPTSCLVCFYPSPWPLLYFVLFFCSLVLQYFSVFSLNYFIFFFFFYFFS